MSDFKPDNISQLAWDIVTRLDDGAKLHHWPEHVQVKILDAQIIDGVLESDRAALRSQVEAMRGALEQCDKWFGAGTDNCPASLVRITLEKLPKK